MYAKVRSPPSVNSFYVTRYSAIQKLSFSQKFENTKFQHEFVVVFFLSTTGMCCAESFHAHYNEIS